MNLNNLFSFDVVDNNIKVTYNGNEIINVTFSIKLLGISSIIESKHYTFYEFGHWVVPTFNYIGCKYLSIYNKDTKEELINWLIPKELSNGVNSQNIICLGLNKAGTTSFECDTKSLGYSYSPLFDCMSEVMSDLYHGDYNTIFSILDNPRFNAHKDLPFSLPKIYEKLYQHRPNDIYILTLRKNTEDWVNSVKKYFGWLMNHPVDNNPTILTKYNGPLVSRYSNFIKPMFTSWGINNFDNLDSRLSDVYNKHTDECTSFFERKNSKNFKVLTIGKPGELKVLTSWLGIKNDKEDFSWENKSN